MATFIYNAALGKKLSAALTIKESERMKRTPNIHGLPFVTDAIRKYICRTNEYFKTST